MEFRLVIITPTKTYMDKNVESIALNNGSGTFTVLANHASMISNVEIGLFKVKSRGTEQIYSIGDGTINISSNTNTATICVSSIESTKELNYEQVMQDKSTALMTLKASKNEKELRYAEILLKKSISRLSLLKIDDTK